MNSGGNVNQISPFSHTQPASKTLFSLGDPAAWTDAHPA